ncbi:MAG: CarD family transcriptional regulator [Blastocatellia bacterium]
MDFKPGQKVIYPNHGIAVIEQLETRQIDATSVEFYLLRVQDNDSTVLIPRKNADQVGLRRLITGSQVESLLETLAEDFEAPSTDWKNRFKGFSEKMRTGNIFAMADVLKTLTFLHQQKPLSFREKQMLERARHLVISEIACVSRRAEQNIATRVDDALLTACARHNNTWARNAGAA